MYLASNNAYIQIQSDSWNSDIPELYNIARVLKGIAGVKYI